MPRPALFAAAVVALVAGGCGSLKDVLTPPAVEFTGPDGAWKARFPGNPTEKSKAALGITFTMFVKETWQGTGGYAVGLAELPLPGRETDAEIQKRLDDGVTGSVGGVGGVLKESHRSTLHGRYPGREFTATVTDPKPGLYRSRLFLVGKRMYVVAVMGVESFVTAPAAEEFLNSFALVGEVAPAAASNPLERLATAAPKAPPAPAAAAGVPIHSTNGKFKARFPASPAKGTATTDDITFTTYAATAHGATFAAGYADRPELDGAAAKDRQAALDAARDAAVAELAADAKLGKCELLVLAGRHRGWEFAAAAGDRALRGRVYLVGNRLYRLTVRGSADSARDPAAAAFFESFQVVN